MANKNEKSNWCWKSTQKMRFEQIFVYWKWTVQRIVPDQVTNNNRNIQPYATHDRYKYRSTEENKKKKIDWDKWRSTRKTIEHDIYLMYQ